MPIVKTLDQLDLPQFAKVMQGYVSHEKYTVNWQESADRISFELELISLETPYTKQFEPEDETYYESIFDPDFSLAAYEGDEMLGFTLAEAHTWNKTLWIHELHVAKAYQGKGLGQLLMNILIEKAKVADFRLLVLECQNTNVPAIRFYHKMGFRIEAVDMSLYSNEDYPDGEIALYMKLRVFL